MRLVGREVLAIVAVFAALPATAQTPSSQIVDDIAAICATPSGSLEDSAAAVATLGGRYRSVNEERHAELVAPHFHSGMRAQPGLHRAFVTSREPTVVFEFRALDGTFGQLADFLVTNENDVRAGLIARFGAPRESDARNGDHVETFQAGAESIMMFTRPSAAARVVCGLPLPPDPAPLTIEQQAAQLSNEAWQVCGLRGETLGDAIPVVGLLPGRYRRAREEMRDTLRDSAGAMVTDAEAGIEIAEQNFYFRRMGGGGGVVVLELTAQRRNGATRVIANFRLIQLDPAILVRAVEGRFGPRDSIGVGAPPMSNGRPVDMASFGRYSPQDAGSRRLMVLLGGEVISMHCFLREFE